MENKDYNAPEGNYQYTNPYENTEYNNPYSNAQNNAYGGYANLGGVMVDEKGKPLTNRFAMKLVFSILEILSCCMSPIASILGIIACVFTCQANSAYNEGRPYDFRSKARTSAILLWIGGAFIALSLIINIIIVAMFSAAFQEMIEDGTIPQEYIDSILNGEYEGDYGEMYEDIFNNIYGDMYDDGFSQDAEEPEINEEYFGNGDVALAEGFNQFVLNGVTYEVPMSYSTFVGMGYTLQEFDENAIYPADDYEIFNFEDSNGNAGVVRVSNVSTEPLAAKDCQVDYFCVYSIGAYEMVSGACLENIDLTFIGGLDETCSYEDLTNQLGTATYVYTETYDAGDIFVTYSWYYEGLDEYQRIDISFWNDKMCDFTIDNYEYTQTGSF